MDLPSGLPSVTVTVDRAKIGRLGIHAGDLLDVLTTSRSGLKVGTVREEERVFDLMLRLGGDEVHDSSDLGRLPIATSQGNIVPVSMVAHLTEARTVVQVGREQMRRRLIVQCNVRQRDMVGFVKEAQSRVGGLEMPKPIEIVWGGQFQNFKRATDRLLLMLPVVLGLIAIMLIVAFRKTRYVFATVLSLPFAIAGGTVGLFARGLPFSIPAGVGFIALSGVSVMTGIVITSSLLATPRTMSTMERVRSAAPASFRAPLSTGLVAALGFIPAALATGMGAEVQRPLATAVIFGLLVGMIMSMVALPTMLLLIARAEAPSKRTAPTQGFERPLGAALEEVS